MGGILKEGIKWKDGRFEGKLLGCTGYLGYLTIYHRCSSRVPLCETKKQMIDDDETHSIQVISIFCWKNDTSFIVHFLLLSSPSFEKRKRKERKTCHTYCVAGIDSQSGRLETSLRLAGTTGVLSGTARIGWRLKYIIYNSQLEASDSKSSKDPRSRRVDL